MKPIELSTCFVTEDVSLCRDFYTRYFNGKIVFDCGWYLNIVFENNDLSVQFMEPQEGMSTFNGEGVVINFSVEDVDKEYQRLMDEGFESIMPLEDHPWGDRGFSVSDPIGVIVYIYTKTEPTDEFKQYYKD